MTRIKIVSDPNILRGKPVVAGTRISVEMIMDLLIAGMSVEEILSEYSHLTKESVLDAITFAENAVTKETIYPLVEDDGSVSFATA
jgi:uncharacterized protein (DUF433 family)